MVSNLSSCIYLVTLLHQFDGTTWTWKSGHIPLIHGSSWDFTRMSLESHGTIWTWDSGHIPLIHGSSWDFPKMSLESHGTSWDFLRMSLEFYGPLTVDTFPWVVV